MGNATTNVADIVGTANGMLRLYSVSTGLAFGASSVAAAAAVRGVLGSTNGGAASPDGGGFGGAGTATNTNGRMVGARGGWIRNVAW